MGKLDTEARFIAMQRLQSKLEQAIGESPKGLTYDDLQECWNKALEYWDMKKGNGAVDERRHETESQSN